MIKEKRLIRSILGPGRWNVSALAYAVKEAEVLLFSERIAMDDIQVTKDIYPKVAERVNKPEKNVARQVERHGNLCWEKLSLEEKRLYIGRDIADIRGPRDMIFYLAFYAYFQKSYYEVIRDHPELLFSEEDFLE